MTPPEHLGQHWRGLTRFIFGYAGLLVLLGLWASIDGYWCVALVWWVTVVAVVAIWLGTRSHLRMMRDYYERASGERIFRE